MDIVALLLAVALQCPVCGEVDRLVESGDTARAIEMLRDEVEERRGAREDLPPELSGRLGELLVYTAESRTAEFEERAEAQALLQDAINQDQDNARWWYAMGLLDRKRGLQLDASRYLDQALELAEDDPGSLRTFELARLHAEKARALEEHVLDFRGFVPHANEIPVVQGGDETCGVAFCLNFERPDWFHDILFSFETEDDLVAEDEGKMRELFAEAFGIDPSHRMAGRGWLGHLARSHHWEQYVEVARAYDGANENDPWSPILLGAGLHRTGNAAAADSAFRRGLAGLDEEDRNMLQSLEIIIRKSDVESLAGVSEERRRLAEGFTWTRLDPFYLTEANERRLEHFTRVALAELWYGDPRIRERGARTDPGVLFIRYGEPRWVRQIRITDAAAGAIQDAFGGAKPAPGGRWIFWTYSKNLPSFVLEKRIGSRRIQHANNSASKETEEWMRERSPSTYRPANFQPLTHQVAVFKGTRAHLEADVILSLPRVEAGGDEELALAEAAVFVSPTGPGVDPVGLRTTVDLAGGDRTATFRLPLNRGVYPLSIEVMAEDRSAVGTSRTRLDVAEWGQDDLFISDLLVADSISAGRDQPTDRRHFRISARPNLEFPVGQPLAVYFEIYGLEEEDGQRRYEVEVRVRDEGGDGVLGGIARGISGLFGGGEPERDGNKVTWSGTADARNDRVLEWFSLGLPELEPGTYTVEVKVKDQNEGREAERVRTITVADPGAG